MCAGHGHNLRTPTAAISPDGRFMLSLDHGRWLLWGVQADRPLRIGSVTGLPDGPLAIALAADGRSFVVGGADGSLAAFDLGTGGQWWSAPAHRSAVVAVAVPGGSRVISVGADGSVWTGELPSHDAPRPARRSGTLVRRVAAAGVVFSVAVGWLPAWCLALLPVVAGVRAARRVRFTFSLSERELTRA